MSELDWQSESLKGVLKRIHTLNLPVPQDVNTEDKEVMFPDNLADLDDGELAYHRALWTKLYSKLSYILSKAETDMLAAEEKLKFFKNKALLDITPKPGSSKRDLAIAELDKDVVKANLLFKHKEAFYKVYKGLLASYEIKSQAVSRELSWRIAKLNNHIE